MTADTQNPGGWPDAARPGVPQNSDRDGWHWLHHPEDLRPCPIPWDADHAAWCSGSMHSPQGVVDLGYRYLGPCLTPAEVAARLSPEARRVFLAAKDNPASLSFDERMALRGAVYRISSKHKFSTFMPLAEAPFGWAVSDEPWTYTPLGLAVRAVIEKESSDA